jgi:hypothetical protein
MEICKNCLRYWKTQKWKKFKKNSRKKENRARWHTSFKIRVLSLFSKVHSYLYYFDSVGNSVTTGNDLECNIFRGSLLTYFCCTVR